MPSKNNVYLTERDGWILSILQLGPLDCNQICLASQACGQPFRTPHKVAARMRRLKQAGVVSIHSWLDRRIATRNYYVITPVGRGLVLSSGTFKRSMFGEVSFINQRHTHKTAEVTATTVAAASQLGLAIEAHTGDKQFSAVVPGVDSLKPNEPDRRCVLVSAEKRIEMWDEIDLHNEAVGGQGLDTLESKIRFHVARRQAMPSEDYVVRVFFLRDGLRMQHFLDLARRLAIDNQFIFLATTLDRYTSDASPLTNPIFRDHAGRPRVCYKPYRPARQQRALETIVNPLAEPMVV